MYHLVLHYASYGERRLISSLSIPFAHPDAAARAADKLIKACKGHAYVIAHVVYPDGHVDPVQE